MFFKNGDSFEALVFGRYFVGDRDYVKYQSFSQSMMDLIKCDTGPAYPDTRLGKLFYFGVYNGLRRQGIDPNGLKFKSALRSRADIHHSTDGYFYLPSVPDTPVTIDLFNLDSEICHILRDRWDDDDDNEEDFQTNLFRYKKGMADIMKKGDKTGYWNHIFNPFNFVSLVKRPENHFVLTPYHTESRQRRKEFAAMVARYFLKASSQNMAKQSH